MAPLASSYECMVILRPALSKEETDKLLDRFCGLIKAQGGEVVKVDRMGRRKIAYAMKKQTEGFYATITFTAPGSAVAELERNLRISEDVLKFQTLRIDPAKVAAGRKREAALPPPAPSAQVS